MWRQRFKQLFPWQTLKESLIAYRGVWLGLGLITFLSIYSQLSVRRARFWVDHTFDVLDTIQQIEFNLLEAQADLQTFLTDNNPAKLARYRQALKTAQQTFSTLRALTVDNSTQQQNLRQLEELLEQRLRIQQGLLQQQKPKIQSDNNSKAELSQLYTDEMQEQMGDIQQEEYKLLRQRRQIVNQQGAFASGTILVSIAITGFLSWQASRDRVRQQQAKADLSQRLQSIELEQDLSSHLLTCRNFAEAHDILQSFLSHLLPHCSGAIYEINNSRDQMVPSITFGEAKQSDAYSPRECWALRRGELQMGQQATFRIPCKLCRALYATEVPETMMCLPLQAHEQTIGILHLAQVPTEQQLAIKTLAHQISLPLAVLHLQAELEYLSFHDANTGIYNRRFLDEMISRAIASARRQNHRLPEGGAPYSVGVIFMDVDHFKRFNSEHGHEMGDTVLRMVGTFLVEMTRAGEDTPCRYGGEEFVVVMPGADEASTLAKAEKIRQGIKRRPTPTGHAISVSIGVATYPKNGITPDEVLKAANIALLRAKAEGRDQVLLAD